MTLISTSTLTVTDQTPTTASASVVVQPPSSVASSAKGRLVHPSLGTYDYSHSPDEVVNIDGAPLYKPTWSRVTTLGGAVDALWSGYLRDARVIERWRHGEAGAPIALLRALWQFFSNPPNPESAYVVWTPNYMGSSQGYRVAMVDVRCGGAEYTLDRRLLSYGYAPGPVELEMRVIALAP